MYSQEFGDQKNRVAVLQDQKQIKSFKVNRKLWRPIREVITEMNVDVPYLKLIHNCSDKPAHSYMITGHISGIFAQQ